LRFFVYIFLEKKDILIGILIIIIVIDILIVVIHLGLTLREVIRRHCKKRKVAGA
jgi:hypothetical protein